jgi:hypothetical protein
MTVLVFAGVTQIDEQVFDNEEDALDFADEWQDRGFIVRIIEHA